MPKTDSFYASAEAERILSDEFLLTMHKGKKTAIVNAALREYHRNHRPMEQPQEVKIPTFRVKIHG